MNACRQGNGSRVTALENAALHGKRVASSLSSLSSFLLSLALACPAHAPGATDSSGLGGHRAHAPVPTSRAPLTPSLTIFLYLSRAGHSSPCSFSLLSSRDEYSYTYIYVHFSPSPGEVSSPTHLPSISYDSVVSIGRTSNESSRPSCTANMPPARLDSAIIDVSYRGDSYLRTLAHFSPDASPPSSRPRGFLPSRRNCLTNHPLCTAENHQNHCFFCNF